MHTQLMKKLDTMLTEAAAKKTWGEIQIDLKNGRPILVRQTIQSKIEDYPGDEARKQIQKY